MCDEPAFVVPAAPAEPVKIGTHYSTANTKLHKAAFAGDEEHVRALIASGVDFASTDAEHADEVHLFNFDRGTVWWDDITIRL